MGQRTQAIVRVTTSKNGKTKVSTFAHHFQWGIGRVMPKAILPMLLGMEDDWDIHNAHKKALDLMNTLNRGESNLIEVENTTDILDKEALLDTMDNDFDNNNGLMIVDVKIEMDEYFRTNQSVSLGFLYGYEEYDRRGKKGEWIPMYDYMLNTWHDSEETRKLLKDFENSFTTILEQYYDVEFLAE